MHAHRKLRDTVIMLNLRLCFTSDISISCSLSPLDFVFLFPSILSTFLQYTDKSITLVSSHIHTVSYIRQMAGLTRTQDRDSFSGFHSMLPCGPSFRCSNTMLRAALYADPGRFLSRPFLRPAGFFIASKRYEPPLIFIPAR
jgi:hypothetical protein